MLENFEDFFKTKAALEITKNIGELVEVDEFLRKFLCLPTAYYKKHKYLNEFSLIFGNYQN